MRSCSDDLSLLRDATNSADSRFKRLLSAWEVFVAEVVFVEACAPPTVALHQQDITSVPSDRAWFDDSMQSFGDLVSTLSNLLPDGVRRVRPLS